MQLVPFTHFLQSFHNLKCQILCFFLFHRLELWIFAFFLCILHNFFSIFLLKTSFFYNFSYVFLCFSDSSFGFIIHLTYAMLLFIITLILYFMKKTQKGDTMILSDFFQQHPQAAIGFSGGVDSAYLAYCAKKYAQNMLAIYYKSEFQPEFEFKDAKRFCTQHGIPLKILYGSVLNDDTIIDNPKNRCYYCKQRIFSAIQKEALTQGFPILLDGTNASDEVNDRPGMLALKELHVISPLRLCGLTKKDIRLLSKEAGLFTWDKPSYACLATRIPTGMKITGELLHAIESCENILFSMGFSDFRVRVRDGYALLQVTESDYPKASASLDHIQQAFAAYFPKVVLDTQVR